MADITTAPTQPTTAATLGASPVIQALQEPRLIISKIVCKNFKSYAGVKELGPFHKCFTSIVGPNGSGKSNVIDSMLFVFGYRARKIRSRKVSVLIHNSTHHQNIQSCTVSVHFEMIKDLPGDSFEVVPGSQFVVSRTAHRDNSSHYQLNGKKVPFKDVATLLRGSGIDLDHNRFLILQGEVEQIALMKPKAQSENDDGMLEFLEDIIGTSQFKEPIEQLSKKVEELTEERSIKLNRAKAVEKEKASLEGAKAEAEHYLSLQLDMSTKQNSLYSRYIYECCQHELKAKKRKGELEETVADKQSQRAELTARKKEKIKAVKKDKKRYDQLQEESEECQQQLSSCEQRDVLARQALKTAKNSLKKLTKNLSKERDHLVELEAVPEKMDKEIKELEKKIRVLENRKKEEEQKLSAVLESLKTATQGLQEEKEGHELRLVDLNQAVNEVKSKLDVVQAELDIYREKFMANERQLKEAQENLEQTKSSIAEKKKRLVKLESEVPSKKKQLSKTQSDLDSITTLTEKLSREVKESSGQMQEAKSSMAAQNEKGQVLTALLKQKESGALPGICGRLGDLGVIDDKYDVAISTACGPLDYIVVDNMETAMKAVDFLKKNNLGVGTFIGLDKMEKWSKQAKSKITTPENVPRLYDLVRPKEARYHNVFYHSLRDTLVAEDLEQATRIGLKGSKRHRVVTLSGQLVDMAGTMSGGGGKASRGRMSSKLVSNVSKEQLAELEQKLKTGQTSLQESLAQRTAMEEKVQTLKLDLSNTEKEIKQLQRDIAVLVVKQESITARVSELEVAASEQEKMDPAHLARLEKEVKGHTKDHRKALGAAEEVKAEVERLHAQIMSVGGSRMQTQQAQVDAICSEIDSSQVAITKATVAIKTNGRNLKKCNEKISSLEGELADTENKIEEAKNQMAALVEEAKEIVEKQAKLKEMASECGSILSTLKESVEAIEAEEAVLDSGLVDIQHELDKYVTKIRENNGRIKHFQAEIKKLNFGEGEAPTLSDEELAQLDKQTVEYEITVLEERLKQMTPNMAAIDEYKKKDELHQARLTELDAVTTERDKRRGEFEDIRKQRLDQFMSGFSVITSKLKEMYQMITLGGDAELELVDSLDPFSEGIVFSVRPPKKSWKNITNLSGGEKTLSSLALVFALHHYKPSPLYVMDEIDAALDFKNVSIVAHYIKERTKNAQFIIISLRNNMFEQADRLVGIFKTHDATKTCTIDPRNIHIGPPPAVATA